MSTFHSVEELKLDLEEAVSTAFTVQRPALKKKLEEWSQELRTKISSAEKSAAATRSAVIEPVSIISPARVESKEQPWLALDKFAWDQGEYGSNAVSVYLTSGLDGIGDLKDTGRITCNFTSSSLDLKIVDFNGKNYRLLKANLDKEIIPGESKFVVKKNGITLKLRKKKGEYSYEHWTDLTSKKSKEETIKSKDDPMGGIMDMMKDMYENGDDQMRKTIGEAMLKSKNGERESGGLID